MLNVRIIRALTMARSIGYWRDKGSLIWSFVVPPALIVCMALAFSGEDPAVFRVGVLTPEAVEAPVPASILAAHKARLPAVLKADYVELIGYPIAETAIERVRHHQLDMLVTTETPLRYWVNAGSARGQAMEGLLVGNTEVALARETVDGRRVRYVDWVVPGILGMNLMFSGLFGVGYIIVRYRKNGVLKRLSATPVRPLEFLAAQLLSRFVIMLVVAVTVYTAANLTLDLLMLGSYWTLALIAVCGNLALISLALVVTARVRSDELAGGLLNLMSLPMLLLSEVWFSLDAVPQWMQKLSQFLPLTHLVRAARKVMVEGASLAEVSHHLIVLIAIALVCTITAARIFRWE